MPIDGYQVDAAEFAALVTECEQHLCSVVDALPNRSSAFVVWCRSVMDVDSEVLSAMGLPTLPDERRALLIGVESDAPAFMSLRRTLRERFEVYIGGLAAVASHYALPDLHARTAKLRELASMVAAADGAKQNVVRRTPVAVARALTRGDLAMYRTSEVDSDLWVVLKTLQEWRAQWHTPECRKLIARVTDTAREEVESPGSRIADRRHAWWTARTLAEVAGDESLGASPRDACDLIESLLTRPVYMPPRHVAERTFVPEAEGDATTLWELVNVAECLTTSGGALPPKVVRDLIRRRDALAVEALHEGPYHNVRRATVAIRAAFEAIASLRHARTAAG